MRSSPSLFARPGTALPRRAVAAAALAVALLIAITAPPASAAFPGRNGRILITRGGEIVSMNSDGSGVRTLTHLHAQAEAPAVSADGRWVAFDARVGGSFQIFKVRIDGTGLKQLTHNTVYDWAPSWSPNGRTIVWTYKAGNGGELWTMHADGSHQKKLVEGGNNEWARYAPNGRYIAFGSDRYGSYDVFTVRADGTHLQRVTVASSLEDFPEWSPDGTRLSFVTNYFAGQQSRSVPSLQGGQTPNHWTPVVPSTQTDVVYDAAWSPDGTYVTYSNGSAIFRVNLATGGLRNLGPQDGYGVGWATAPRH